MVNVWDFSDCNIVEIIDTDGNSFVGKIIDITDAEDKSDLEEYEDSITIKVGQNHIEFLQSDISKITIVS